MFLQVGVKTKVSEPVYMVQKMDSNWILGTFLLLSSGKVILPPDTPAASMFWSDHTVSSKANTTYELQDKPTAWWPELNPKCWREQLQARAEQAWRNVFISDLFFGFFCSTETFSLQCVGRTRTFTRSKWMRAKRLRDCMFWYVFLTTKGSTALFCVRKFSVNSRLPTVPPATRNEFLGVKNLTFSTTAFLLSRSSERRESKADIPSHWPAEGDWTCRVSNSGSSPVSTFLPLHLLLLFIFRETEPRRGSEQPTPTQVCAARRRSAVHHSARETTISRGASGQRGRVRGTSPPGLIFWSSATFWGGDG